MVLVYNSTTSKWEATLELTPGATQNLDINGEISKHGKHYKSKKRSTGVAAPSSLNFGELGLTVGVGTVTNRGGRLFFGDNSGNPQLVGGKFYTDMMSIAPGLVQGQDNPATPDNGFIPVLDTRSPGNPGGGGNVNRLPRVDQWSVDNLTLDGNQYILTIMMVTLSLSQMELVKSILMTILSSVLVLAKMPRLNMMKMAQIRLELLVPIGYMKIST